MLIGDIFERDVTRAIPPVVYFHEQEPAELKREVEEYIVTGGYPRGDARATEEGIHEQFVRLLSAMKTELRKSGGPELPACWISGFYGSGKSSFAKLLGLSLDGRTLDGGKLLSDALIGQDHSPDAKSFRAAWDSLVGGLEPMAVVFDVGSQARDDEQVHAVIVRQAQIRFGYSAASNLVAEYELKLELEGRYDAFLDKVQEVHGKPWGKLKDLPLAEDYFSAVLHKLDGALYTHPLAWVDSRSGSRFDGKRSADEAVLAIKQMVDKRFPGRTLFVVVDEVSQYVHENDDRMLALQSFVQALGQRMKGSAWLLATGQQKLDEGSGVATSLLKLKDRFPPSLRVHLGIANIRDVVYKRLLRKKRLLEADLKALFQKHRPELALYAYQGDQVSETDFVEIYPMLPGHIGLLLDITTGLRSRSTRTQGDSHAIRGLLQLLGDLFREKGLVKYELGRLITIDLIYDVLHTALDTDVQMTIARAMDFAGSRTTAREGALMIRVIKAVAMLELVQERQKTSPELVARCLYEKLGDGNALPDVQTALDALVGESLLGYSDKTGYKIESSAGQEWQRERDGYPVGPDLHSEKVRDTLEALLSEVPTVQLDHLPLPWLALYSDSIGTKDAHIHDERKYTVVTVDFQFTKAEGADEWVPRSDTKAYRDRIIWVVGDMDIVRASATKLTRSARMIERYGARQGALADDRQRLLIDERNRFDAAQRELVEAVKAAFMSGEIYFQGRPTTPRDAGANFGAALAAFGNRVVRELYPNPATFTVTEKDIVFLIENVELAAPPAVLGQERLGILTLDAGRYEVTCSGRVPTDVLAFVRESPGVTGSTLLAHFGASPYGVPPDVLRAAVVGLLRGHKLRVEIAGVGEITSVRDEGVRELTKETGLRKARLSENTVETLSPRDRNAICALFKDLLGKDVARDPEAIADAVTERFSGVRERLTVVADRFRRLPRDVAFPKVLDDLGHALEACRRVRRVEPTIIAVKRHLPVLRDGLTVLSRTETDLTDHAIQILRDAEDVSRHAWPSLLILNPSEEARASGLVLEAHLKSDRPWEDTGELAAHIERVRSEARARRRAVLDAHGSAVDAAIDRLKRRAGFERLDLDESHLVLRHLREGGAANTDERAVAPALEGLEAKLATLRETAEAKALAMLDSILETKGGPAVVEVSLQLSGRELETEAELERLLEEIRSRIAHELVANHRVRIK